MCNVHAENEKIPAENATHAIDDFKSNLSMLILSLEKPFYCLGNFNINLLNIYARDEIRRYTNMLLCCDCRCLIDVPTKVTETSKTLIDHVITNDKQKNSSRRSLDIKS